MTKWLVKKFIKNYENTENLFVRNSYGKLSGVVGILCNALLFFSKIIVGTVSGSVSITADAVNNLSDASSSVISLLGFKLSMKPADDEHPYGHGRYEYLAGLMVAILIIVIGVELLKSSFAKIIAPSDVVFNWVFMGILFFSMALKLWMALFNNKMGNAISSQTLLATAQDSRNDVITTGAVLIASIISNFSHVNLDGFIGLGVALFILYSGFGLIKDTLDPLLGRAPDPQLVAHIQKKILSYPDVLGTHDLMIHDYGPGRQFASVHVEMAAEVDVIASHDVIDNIERDFQHNDNLHMLVHFDPVSSGDCATADFRQWLSENIKTINESLTIHDLRMVYGKTHTNAIFDCVIPNTLNMKETELKSAISALVNTQYPDYFCVVTIDRDYAALPH